MWSPARRHAALLVSRLLFATIALGVVDAGEPYKVLTGPPSINRLIGLAALAAILHPETFKMVPDDITRVETTLFPIPPGLAEPAPLQVFP